MGKITGFLEFQRLAEASEGAATRTSHYHEFVLRLTDDQARQQGARCMDCGIPFCQTGCPVNNIIPDWNDLVFNDRWQDALATLHQTNNFPEFTGRVCPAPCEAACTLNINDQPVGIKSIEHAIIDKGWEMGWIVPEPAPVATGKVIAIVGSGPAGLAAAQQLARAGHRVTVFEKSPAIGGLMRFGIPDFKMEKHLIDRRMTQMEAEGVTFRPNVEVGVDVAIDELVKTHDAVLLCGGAELPRDLPVPGRDLEGVHFAMEFLPQQNLAVAGHEVPNQITAKKCDVLVIGGGDTGSDCVGTSNRQKARSVSQIELLPQPPREEDKAMSWPYWPLKLRTSSSHEEGCERDWAVTTKAFLPGADGKRVGSVKMARIEWQKDAKTGLSRMVEVADSEFEIKANLVLLAMGFLGPRIEQVIEPLKLERDARGNVRAATEGETAYQTSHAKVFAAGDMRRGQSLVVWAIREGRQCAQAVDRYLMGESGLPR